jgi:hypothetical protein
MFVNDLSFRVNDDENQNLLGQALWQIHGDRPLVVGYGFWIGRLSVIVVNLDRLKL